MYYLPLHFELVSLSRYELGFRVSDVSQGQWDVEANVSVEVKSLERREVMEVTPLTLAADTHRVVQQEPQVRASGG